MISSKFSTNIDRYPNTDFSACKKPETFPESSNYWPEKFLFCPRKMNGLKFKHGLFKYGVFISSCSLLSFIIPRMKLTWIDVIPPF